MQVTMPNLKMGREVQVYHMLQREELECMNRPNDYYNSCVV